MWLSLILQSNAIKMEPVLEVICTGGACNFGKVLAQEKIDYNSEMIAVTRLLPLSDHILVHSKRYFFYTNYQTPPLQNATNATNRFNSMLCPSLLVFCITCSCISECLANYFGFIMPYSSFLVWYIDLSALFQKSKSVSRSPISVFIWQFNYYTALFFIFQSWKIVKILPDNNAKKSKNTSISFSNTSNWNNWHFCNTKQLVYSSILPKILDLNLANEVL